MKKLLALVLAAIMAFSVMSFATAEAAEEPFVLSVMLPDFYTDVEFVREGNPLLDYIQEQTGVKLDIQLQANSSYGDILATTLATPDSMPNLISFPGRDNTFVQNVNAFWDLTPYVFDTETYPWLANEAGLNIHKSTAVDGKVYGVFRSRAFPRAGIYYRSDIAAQVGITKEPETIEELTALAEALAGYSEDTYALNMVGNYTAGTINVITVAMGAPNTWGVDENGNVYPAHESPAYLEGLKWLRHLYEIGGIDPNFVTVTSSDWDNIERTGKAFMRFDCNDNAHRQQEWFEKNEGVTEQIFEELIGLKKADGSITCWPQNAGYAGLVVVTKTVKEEDLPKVMKFLDWCNSYDGQMLLNAGLENVTYWIWADGTRHTYPEEVAGDSEEMVAKQKEYTDKNVTIQGSINQLTMGVPGDLTSSKYPTASTPLRDEYAANNIEFAKYAVLNPCATLTSETYTAFGSTLDTLLSDAAVQFISCVIDEDELKSIWEQWSEEGGEQIKAEYTAAYQAANAQ